MNWSAIVGTNGAGVKGTAAVAFCGLSRGSRGKIGHAGGDSQNGIDRELHLGALKGWNRFVI
jgi:ABC-type branched-subunit amino acid transport system ATPase component